MKPSKLFAWVLCPWRASGSTVEITLSLATLRAMLKDAVFTNFYVLADDGGEQGAGLGDEVIEFSSLEDNEAGVSRLWLGCR